MTGGEEKVAVALGRRWRFSGVAALSSSSSVKSMTGGDEKAAEMLRRGCCCFRFSFGGSASMTGGEEEVAVVLGRRWRFSQSFIAADATKLGLFGRLINAWGGQITAADAVEDWDSEEGGCGVEAVEDLGSGEGGSSGGITATDAVEDWDSEEAGCGAEAVEDLGGGEGGSSGGGSRVATSEDDISSTSSVRDGDYSITLHTRMEKKEHLPEFAAVMLRRFFFAGDGSGVATSEDDVSSASSVRYGNCSITSNTRMKKRTFT